MRRAATGTDDSTPERDGAWQRSHDDHVERNNRLTWPVIEGLLHVWTKREPYGDQSFGFHPPVNFLHGDFTQDDAERIRAAVERTLRREFRKIWDRHADAEAIRRADRMAQLRSERVAMSTDGEGSS